MSLTHHDQPAPQNPHAASLADRIRNAVSHAELDSLLQQAESYVYANHKTRRKWKRCAHLRRMELNS